MEAMQEQEILQAFLKLMEENSRKEQAQDLTLLLSYLRDMEHQLDAVVNELHTVKRELAEQKAGLNPAGRREVSAKVKQLEGSAYHLFEQIEKLRNQIVTCAANALDSVKQAGTVALDRAVSAMGLGKALAAIQRSASQSMADTKRHIEGIETIGHELRSVGGHLKKYRAHGGRQRNTACRRQKRRRDSGRNFSSAARCIPHPRQNEQYRPGCDWRCGTAGTGRCQSAGKACGEKALHPKKFGGKESGGRCPPCAG